MEAKDTVINHFEIADRQAEISFEAGEIEGMRKLILWERATHCEPDTIQYQQHLESVFKDHPEILKELGL